MVVHDLNMTESFPRQKALTRGFRLGAPRSFRLNAERKIVLFIRSESGRSAAGSLWCAEIDAHDSTRWLERQLVDSVELVTGEIPEQERARRERMREVTEGITAFSVDDLFTSAAFVVNGELYVVTLPSRSDETVPRAKHLETGGGCIDPQISPDGSHIAYVRDGGVHCVEISTGQARVLVTAHPDEVDVTWGWLILPQPRNWNGSVGSGGAVIHIAFSLNGSITQTLKLHGSQILLSPARNPGNTDIHSLARQMQMFAFSPLTFMVAKQK